MIELAKGEKIVTISDIPGNTRICEHDSCGCFKFRYDGLAYTCVKCRRVRHLSPNEHISPYPRPGMEYWDQLCDLPSYSFFNINNCCKRIPDDTGRYLEKSDVEKLLDDAQSEINHLKKELVNLKHP